MTKDEFLKDYYCKVRIQNPDNLNQTIITEVLRRENSETIDGVETSFNIRRTNNWINDSNSSVSLLEWSWEKLLDRTRRMQLDYFAQRVPIEDYLPMDEIENPDISDMYR